MGDNLRMAALSLGLVAIPATATERLYVAIVHVLQTDGEYKKYPLATTKEGVGETECEMRKDAWLSDVGKGLDAAKVDLAKQGLHGEITVRCEPI